MTDDCAHTPLISRPVSGRQILIREAFRLEWFTISWMAIEAVVAIAAGVAAGSLVLIAFGLDSVIELISAGVLMWRLLVELRRGQKFSDRAEHIASRIGGALLFLLAIYITAAAVWRLWSGTGELFFMAGLHCRADCNSSHALFGTSQDRHCRKDRQPRSPCRCRRSRHMRLAVVYGCHHARRSMACRRMVD
jgi:hypothetical protein